MSIERIELKDTFRGDTTHLISSIKALLEMDAAGALVPHGVGGHGRTLLSAAAVRLAASQEGIGDRPTAENVLALLVRAVKEIPSTFATERWTVTPLQIAWVVGMLLKAAPAREVAPQPTRDYPDNPLEIGHF